MLPVMATQAPFTALAVPGAAGLAEGAVEAAGLPDAAGLALADPAGLVLAPFDAAELAGVAGLALAAGGAELGEAAGELLAGAAA